MAFKSNRLILSIILLGFLLRLVAINQSFWLDESIGALVARDMSYNQLINDFMLVDNHPPLYYLFIKLWTGFFGYSELSFRLPSVFASLLSIYFTYRICLLWIKDKKVAYVSALFLAVSQFYVYYSQEARMYMLASSFLAMSLFYFLKTIKKPAKYDWIGFCIPTTCLVFTDYLPGIFLLSYPLFALAKGLNKRWWIRFFFSLTPVFVLGLLWLPYFLTQLQNSPYVLQALDGWKDIAGGASIRHLALVWAKFTLGRISFHDKFFYFSLIALSSIPFLAAIYSSIKRKYFIWHFFGLFPLIFIFVLSFFVPAFNYFRLTFLYPIFSVVIAGGLVSLKNYKVFTFVILFTQLVALSVYFLDSEQQREQWRQATRHLERTVEDGAVVLFAYPKPFSPFRWYESGKLEAKGAFLKVNSKEPGTKERIEELIDDKKNVYTFNYLQDLTDKNDLLGATISSSGFDKIYENADFVGIGKIIKWQSL